MRKRPVPPSDPRLRRRTPRYHGYELIVRVWLGKQGSRGIVYRYPPLPYALMQIEAQRIRGMAHKPFRHTVQIRKTTIGGK